MPPGTLPYPPQGDFSDATLAHWPNAAFLRQSVWRAGQWPLWRPDFMLGAPFAANPLAKVWYPPQWIVLIPGLSVTLALNLLIVAHVLWGMLGMQHWAKAEGLSPVASNYAALAYGLAPKLVAHLGAGHLDLVYAMGWATWWLWAVRQHAGAHQPSAFLKTGAVAALMALADLRLAAYALVAGGLYAISLKWRARDGALALATFLLLTAVYSMPLLVMGPTLTRANLTPTEAAIFSLSPAQLAGMILPDFGGYVELMTYTGIWMLALALLALRTRESSAWIWWGITLFSGLYALGPATPFYSLLVKWVPTLTWLRVPSRAWFVVMLALTFLSARGLDSLLNKELSPAIRLSAAGLGMAGLIVTASTVVFRQPELPHMGLTMLATCVALFMAGRAFRGYHPAVWILAATLALSYLTLDVTLLQGHPEQIAFRPAETFPVTNERVYTPDFGLLPHEATRYNLMTLHGVDPIQIESSTMLIARAAGVENPAGYAVTAPPPPAGAPASTSLADVSPDVALLAALGVSRVSNSAPLNDAMLEPLNDGPRYDYAVRGARPLAYLVKSSVDLTASPDALPLADGDTHIETWTPNRVALSVDAPDASLLVVTQAWASGWRARVDDETAQVLMVAGGLQGVPIEIGQHHVELVYRPVADLLGAAISVATALALSGYGLWQRRHPM